MPSLVLWCTVYFSSPFCAILTLTRLVGDWDSCLSQPDFFKNFYLPTRERKRKRSSPFHWPSPQMLAIASGGDQELNPGLPNGW